MTWTDPIDPSGLDKVWWKLGSAPTSNADGYCGDLPDSKPLCVYNPSQQTVTLYVWLQDGADNVDYHNYASVTLPGNPNLPAVAITGPTSSGTYATSDPLLFLSGTVSDSFGTIDAMAWNDSLGGSGVFFNSGNTWAAPPIQLLPGVNTIFVGAIDDKSSIGATSIVVTYTPVSDQALLFDGNDHVIVPDSPSLNPSQITVETWVNFGRLAYGNGYQPDQAQFLVCKGTDVSPGTYELYQSGSQPGSYGLCFQIGSFRSGSSVGADAPLETGCWYHVAGTYDGDTMKIYLDGTLLSSKTVGAVPVGTNSPLYFGYEDLGGWPYYLTGQMDDAAHLELRTHWGSDTG